MPFSRFQWLPAPLRAALQLFGESLGRESVLDPGYSKIVGENLKYGVKTSVFIAFRVTVM